MAHLEGHDAAAIDKRATRPHVSAPCVTTGASRRLEAETHRNVEVIWLLRHLKPDFKTIADFRRDNRNAFRLVFREFVLLCRQMELFGRELLAVDGSVSRP